MDQTHPIFGHQIEIVENLALYFKSIVVITNQFQEIELPKNIKVIKVNWNENSSFKSALNFYIEFFKILFKFRIDLVFSHMVDTQALLAQPVLSLKRIPHIFWYAHASKSRRANIVSIFCDMNVSSTPGSYPLDGDKITFLGQSINLCNFIFEKRKEFRFERSIHIGRIDPSKKIELLIEFAVSHNLQLELWGKLSESKYGFDMIKMVNNNKKYVSYHGTCSRNEIQHLLKESDLFLHAFYGSLDKSILEATATGIPVITYNQEYLNIFGSWSKTDNTKNLAFLNSELLFLSQLSKFELNTELMRRRKKVEENHSLGQWLANFLLVCQDILNENEKML